MPLAPEARPGGITRLKLPKLTSVPGKGVAVGGRGAVLVGAGEAVDWLVAGGRAEGETSAGGGALWLQARAAMMMTAIKRLFFMMAPMCTECITLGFEKSSQCK